jgi:hypothetical protein
LQQLVLAALALHQQRQVEPFASSFRLEQLVRAAHGAQAGAQEEGATAAALHHRKRASTTASV